MNHRTINKAITISPGSEEREGELLLFSLDGVLPVGQALSVNTDCLIISLVSTNVASGNPILRQSLVTELQLRVLLLLLVTPHYCSHELLLASFFCSYRGLLTGLFSAQITAREEWLSVVQETSLLLERAQVQRTWRKELKQLYNVLSELRAKLRPFGLSITICAWGAAYALISLPASEQQV